MKRICVKCKKEFEGKRKQCDKCYSRIQKYVIKQQLKAAGIKSEKFDKIKDKISPEILSSNIALSDIKREPVCFMPCETCGFYSPELRGCLKQ